MEPNLILKIAGFIIVILGLLLTYNPELVSSKAIPEDVFQASERRVLWGLLLGVGLLLLFHHQLQPWLLTLAATGFALTFGALVARFVGIAMDGSVIKQWYWVGAELVILAVFAFAYVKHDVIKQTLVALFK